MNFPKACRLCGFVDSIGNAKTCPNDGEATWAMLATPPAAEPEAPKKKSRR